ncbi:MAG TPA: Abi-alpha family protein [Jatrophihabitantaceae bacterium]
MALLTGQVVRPLGHVVRNSVTSPTPPARPAITKSPTLHSKLNQLLGRALEQSTAASRHALHHRIMDQLVPDEARIVSALSDGSAFPLINVYARAKSGLPGELLLENACLVGKLANVSLPQHTPVYVSHLHALGLVEFGPADAALKDDYQILMADPAVLKAVKAGSRGPVPPRMERGTLRMSALGRDLWAAASGVQS